MIERKDYILVQLEAIGLLVSKLLGMKQSRNSDQMLAVINDAIRITGLDPDSVDKELDVETVDVLILLQLQQAILVYLSAIEDAQMQRTADAISKHLDTKRVCAFPVS